MASTTLGTRRQSAAKQTVVPTRLILLSGTLALVVLALLAMAQAYNAYGRTYENFRSIAEDSTAKVSAAEQALQFVADIDTYAARFVATASDNPTHWTDLDAIHSSYQNFREQMFTVRAQLDTQQEHDIYDQIDYFAFDQFWQHIGTLLTDQQNGDNADAIKEYIVADNYLQNQIARYLLQLEALNFQTMQTTQQQAGAAITTQVVLLAVLVILLAIGLTALSFWLRNRVRRVFTPGIDVAMVLGWLLAILMLVELAQTPEQLRSMVQDAYYSVSASSRVLAVANQANSSQSGSVIDPTHASFWQESFDSNIASVELRICGQPDCIQNSFTNGGDAVLPGAISRAQQITPPDQQAINGISPLIAKVTFAGEGAALETARTSLQDYLNVDSKVRALLKANNIDSASRLVTGINVGQSAEAFGRFTTTMQQERQINLDVFNGIWNGEKAALPLHQVLFGLGGYVLVIVLLFIGAYHRFREL